MTLRYKTVVNGPFQENCYLVYDDETKKAIFIDPGAEPERLMAAAAALGVDIIGIYNTHGHIDHAGGVSVIREKLGVPFAIHPADRSLLETLPDQARLFGVAAAAVPAVDIELEDGHVVEIGNLKATVIHTPGHSPGGVCFCFDGAIFVGDTLFAGSIGRTDLPGGSLEVLLTSIHRRLLPLDGSLTVLSGHGPPTTIGEERHHNPFLTGRF